MRREQDMIRANSISLAWAKAQLATHARGVDFIAPMVVRIDLAPDIDIEIVAIRQALTEALDAQRKRLGAFKPFGIDTTASLIFPINQFKAAGRDPDALYNRYRRLFHKVIKKYNRYGTYFQRMIDFGIDVNTEEEGKNQLKSLVDSYNGEVNKPVHRASLLQASILDPVQDLKGQAQRGFPCLQQVAFTPLPNDELAVSAFYATQYIFERAYGNYLGLWNLGEFVGSQIGLKLTRLTCMAAKACSQDKSVGKDRLQPLIHKLGTLIETNDAET